MNKYTIGDRYIVETIRGTYEGELLYISRYDTLLFEFGKGFNGHNGDGIGKTGTCWWCDEDMIKSEAPKTVLTKVEGEVKL